jgi:hypothetical protein
MSSAPPGHLWHLVTAFIAGGHQPPRGLVLGSALLALAAVCSRRLWPLTRTVVTLAHEGGHALVALLTGRRLDGVRVLRSTAGVTVSSGRRSGPGIVATTAAGYPTPPLLGLGAAVLLGTGHLLSVLALSLAGLAALTVAIRNAYGLLAILLTGSAIGLVLWSGTPLAQAAFGYALTWFLLLGGVRPVLELRRGRRDGPGASDADQLAVLTGLPGWLWAGVFGLVALAALAAGALWLIR